MKFCVYCASSPRVDPVYFAVAERLGKIFAENNIEVIYGGGAQGLMGCLADAVLDNGGKIIGVMPHFMNDIEWAHRRVPKFIFTETMHERKAKMSEDIDAVVALPGGTGTLEELLETVTLKRLGFFTKPIVVVNTKGYYAPLREMLEKCVQENFMRQKHLDMWCFVNEPEDVLPAIVSAAAWDENAIQFAVP